MKAFGKYLETRYRLGPTNKLERLTSASSKALPAPKRQAVHSRTPANGTYEKQLEDAMNLLLDAEPEDLNHLARRLVEQDPNFEAEGYPAPRTRIGVQALEVMYHNMMLHEEEDPEEVDS
jgi:class 3 adenylate cyclase